jgi:hypothetical protein
MSDLRTALTSALAGTKSGRRALHTFKAVEAADKQYEQWRDTVAARGGMVRFDRFENANKAFAKSIGTYNFHR